MTLSSLKRENFFSILDNRTLIIGALALSIVYAGLSHISVCLISLVFAICLVYMSGQNTKFILHRLTTANFFLIFIWIVTPFSSPEPYLWQFHFISISQPGTNLALLTTIRANAIVCIFIALISPLPFYSLYPALHCLHCPDKLLWILLLLDRNIQNLHREWKNLLLAAKLRGFQLHTNLRSYRVLASMFAILLVRAHKRAIIIHEAMQLRCFSGKLSYIKKNALKLPDYIFLFSIFLFSFLLTILEWHC